MWHPRIIAAIITAIGLIVAAVVAPGIIWPDTSTVQGVVTDTDGMPVARAVVEIDGLSGTTDARGGYVIHDVPIGTKTISVHIPGTEVIKKHALRITKGSEIIIRDFVIDRPTFRISVNPMHGTVQQGGVITTSITVKGEHGYKESVSLSASGQPAGVVVTFIPPIGGPTPAYTSDLTISVGPNVPVADYNIIIKAMGADGQERTTTYTLTVKPPAEITSPKEGDKVPVSIIVKGTILGELPEGRYMWVVINPHPSPGQWWPQEGRVDPWRGQWDVTARFGIGEKFDIAVIFVNEEDDQHYRDYLRIGRETGNYPGIPLAASAVILDRITVTRK